MIRNAIEKLRELAAALDERTARERFMICLSAMAVVFALWNTALMRPLKASRDFANAQIDANQSRVSRLQKETGELEATLSVDPNELNRRTKASLEQEIWKVDERIVEQTGELIPPREMASALRELLRGKRDLELIRLESLPPEPLGGRLDNEEDDASGVYLHTVELELGGSYLSALRYVTEMEGLEWNLLWDSLEFEIEEHPRGRITLRVQSLSTREGWIGA